MDAGDSAYCGQPVIKSKSDKNRNQSMNIKAIFFAYYGHNSVYTLIPNYIENIPNYIENIPNYIENIPKVNEARNISIYLHVTYIFADYNSNY